MNQKSILVTKSYVIDQAKSIIFNWSRDIEKPIRWLDFFGMKMTSV